MPIRLKTDSGDVTVPGAYGLLLTEVAEQAGLLLNTRCGGKGLCEGCALQLQRGHYLVGDEHVTVQPDAPRSALACRTRAVSEDAEILVPHSSQVERGARIEADFTLGHFRKEAQTRKICVRVPPASLERPDADWLRVQHALNTLTELGPLEAAAGLLRELPRVLEEGRGKITVTVGRMDRHWSVIDFEPRDATDTHLGVAVDVGTTTVVAMLVDLNQGRVLKKASMYNQQILKADDVASRISYCRTREQVEELQRLLVEETINALIRQLCAGTDTQPRQICRLAASGNTVMSHLLLGLSPTGIGALPFQPVTNQYGVCPARDAGLAIHPYGLVDVVPSVAGYVGGDITSDIYVGKLTKRTETTVLVDIGTNGEMVLSEENRLLACATAAGPAFEGAGLTHGCRAAEGAIEHVSFGEELAFDLKVIGDAAPTGLCGTAIVDFMAAGLRCGLINSMGRLNVELLKSGNRYLQVGSDEERSHACVLAHDGESGRDGPVFVTEYDLSQVQKAKAATYAGIKTLLASQGKTFADVKRFVLAGAFAGHLDLRNAICIGLLPEIPLELFDVIGNGSLAGAFLALVEAEAFDAYRALARLPQVLELNLHPDFESNFIDGMGLPNLEEGDFPGVMKELKEGKRE